MAGLIAARVLSEFFERVTLFEKDARPVAPLCRQGVPQGCHFHTLIQGGLEIISELLPGVLEQLRAGGALTPRPHEFYFIRPEGKSYAMDHYAPAPPPATARPTMYVQSRPLLEFCVRQAVVALDNVEIRYQSKAKDVQLMNGVVRRVTFEGAETVETDLVVDALGRQGKTLQWLHQSGFETPPEDVVHSDFAYTTVRMRPRHPALFADVGFIVLPDPRHERATRGCGLVRIEGGHWLAFLGGRHGDYPPRDLEQFIQFASSIADPLFFDLIKQAEPVEPPSHYRFSESIRRRFEKLERFPEGLLPIGDAICNYNPLYGQGMSAACRQALALRSCMSNAIAANRGLPGLWKSFFPEAYQETRAPWLLSALADLSDPRCVGDFPIEERNSIAKLQHIVRRAESGDSEAIATRAAITNLTARLDILDHSEAARGTGRRRRV
jgi:2-polyprenyl-6-methoxyphenol hydroxylase-like FAD-dependent oxidoreductase